MNKNMRKMFTEEQIAKLGGTEILSINFNGSSLAIGENVDFDGAEYTVTPL